MRITTKDDGTARLVVEDYGDLLQVRTLSEWHPIAEEPFTVQTTVGNGSEGWEALAWDREFYGVELKRSYYDTACRFLEERATALGNRLPLFEDATV